MKVVIDTNVILVANRAHPDVSSACIKACNDYLEKVKNEGQVFIDDAYRIIGEYLNKTAPNKGKAAGDVFVKWLLNNSKNPSRVQRIVLKETSQDVFHRFPVPSLQSSVDPPDRKFLAVAGAANSPRPAVAQAADCKWLDWWPSLKAAGVTIDFVCPDDVCRSYQKKFPKKPVPSLP